MLPNLLSCAQILERNKGSMMKIYVGMLQRFCHAPIYFVVLPKYLSCSQIFEGKNSKTWEHDKKNWSMTKILEHDINFGGKIGA